MGCCLCCGGHGASGAWLLCVGLTAGRVLRLTGTGVQAIRAKNYSGPPTLNDRSAQMEVFSQFMQDLDAEGRYLVINAAANQLRYPNSHTHYFSWTLLLLFHQAKRVRPCLRLLFVMCCSAEAGSCPSVDWPGL